MRRVAPILAVLLAGPRAYSQNGVPGGKLPRGWEEGLAPGVNWGLAARYPPDGGPERDPDVLVFENFERGKITIPHKEGNRTTPDFPQATKLWMNDIVVARRHIGPARPK